ncbi:MAG: hypothetical protein E7361_04620 [Clostridiales bacterium]|nr:hypothetical protein [Clostridiales bacterium]
MERLKIVIDPLALVALFLFVYFGWIDEILFYIIALVVHEYSHYFVAKSLGYNLNIMTFSPFGASLSGNTNFFKKQHEILIALAGPLINLAITILIVAVWWVFPSLYTATYSFALANVSLFVTNMLPLFPLDAGRIILALIKGNSKFARIYKLYRINSIVIGILLIILFVLSAFNRINLSLLFIAVLLFSSVLSVKNTVYYERVFIDKNKNDYEKILPIRNYHVPVNTPCYKILRFIDKHTYSIFHFVDNSGKILKTVSEKELLSIVTHKHNKDEICQARLELRE